MNTDELLVQLDFDETNVNHHSPQQKQQHQLHTQQQPQSIDSLKRTHLQRPSSPPLNTSEPILSNFLLPDGDNKITDALNATHHHRRAFSDDNALATVTQTIPQSQQHSNNLKTKAAENLSLINLSRSHSSAEEHDDNYNDEDESIRHLEPTTQIISTGHGDGPNQQQHHHHHHHHHTGDDTVEVSLLADLSMDSRESQPLLGIGRDTHDFVYNNFPGKKLSIYRSICISFFDTLFRRTYEAQSHYRHSWLVQQNIEINSLIITAWH